MPKIFCLTLLSSLMVLLATSASHASAQPMSAAQRNSALSQVRTMANCVSRHNNDLQRVLRQIGQFERQRTQAHDTAARRDAEQAIDALIGQAADIQTAARQCVGGQALPRTMAHQAEDPGDSAVQGDQGTVRVIEQNVGLTRRVRIVRAEQVDGHGQVSDSAVRSGVRSIGTRLERCYERYLNRGSLHSNSLHLVFRVMSNGRVSGVLVEQSSFHNASMDTCVRRAGGAMRLREGARGGDATFSYHLRFSAR